MIKEARRPRRIVKNAEDRRKEAMMHMAELARAGKREQLHDVEQHEETQEPGTMPKGLPGFGALHTLVSDSSLKSVKVTHVRNLLPAKLKGLKSAVERMQTTVVDVHAAESEARIFKPDLPLAPPEDGSEMPGRADIPARAVSSDVDVRARRARDVAMAAAAATPASLSLNTATGSREAIHLKFKATMLNHSAAMNKALEEAIREKQAAVHEDDILQKRAEEVANNIREAEDIASKPESVHTIVAHTERLANEHRQASLKVSREDAREKVLEYREAQRARREELGMEVAAHEEAKRNSASEAAEGAEAETTKRSYSRASAIMLSSWACAIVITKTAMVA